MLLKSPPCTLHIRKLSREFALQPVYSMPPIAMLNSMHCSGTSLHEVLTWLRGGERLGPDLHAIWCGASRRISRDCTPIPGLCFSPETVKQLLRLLQLRARRHLSALHEGRAPGAQSGGHPLCMRQALQHGQQGICRV